MSSKTASEKPLAGRVTLVTGASRGVGKGIALQLGKAGATVYITGREPSKSFAATESGLPTLKDTADGKLLSSSCFSYYIFMKYVLRFRCKRSIFPYLLNLLISSDLGIWSF